MASERKPLKPPRKGKMLMAHIVLNVEYWPFDQPMPRKMLSTPHGMEPVPDIPNYCWAEYGLRCGMPRLLTLLKDLKLPASVNLNSSVIERYPSVAEAMRSAGLEFIGHGYMQRLLHKEEDEEATIRKALEQISSFTGKKVRGWMSPGFAQTFDTPDFLKKHGVEFNMDWILDDLPCWMGTKHGPLVCMPYGFELNDSLVYAVERQSSPEVLQRLNDTLKTFSAELKTQPRVLTLALHPHQIGVPHRMPYLVECLKALKKRSDVIWMTGSQIADWYVSADPAPSEL
jgi:peptidoglycan/xylan/chitin deacetylase (PgdA/CDA1 family)